VSTDKSPWLDFVQRFERAIGEPVEQWVRSDAYFDVLTQMKRTRARVTKTFEDYAEQWLHMLNLPAASDVRRLHEQLSRLERRVERMANEIEDRAEAELEPPPRPRPKPKPHGRTPKPK
jgi:hypothetical protein